MLNNPFSELCSYVFCDIDEMLFDFTSLFKWKLMQKYNFVFVDDIFHNYLVYSDNHREIWYCFIIFFSWGFG